jgi:thiol:disulfide interchange protein
MERFRYRLTTACLVVFFLSAAVPSVAQPGPEPPDLSGSVLGKDLDQGPGAVKNAVKNPVTVDAQFTAPAGGKPGRLFVAAVISPGWHIYSITQPTSEKGNPTVTKIEVKLPAGVRLTGPFKSSVAPERKTEPDAYGDLPIETHMGTVTWYAPLELAAGVDPATLKIAGTISYGACDANSCVPPADVAFTAALGHGVALPEDAVPASASTNAVGNSLLPSGDKTAAAFDLQVFLVQLAFAFVGGLILNAMPCVLPVLGLKVLAFVQQAGESRSRVFMLNVWYSVGLIAVFMVLAALAAGVGLAAGERYGWGEQFTDTNFKITMTALVFVMALSFLGVWEIPIPGFVGSGRASDLQSREGPLGAFCKGVFTTILATPCSGPFLGPVFGYVLKQPPYMAYCIFGAVGLGMASPYLLIGAFPSLVRFLPRPGAWMDTFKQLMGFLLLATVVYLFSLLKSAYVIPTMTLLVGLWFACWWIGRTPLTQPARRTVAWCGGTAVAALVGVFAFTVLMEPPKIPWKPFSPAAVAQARAENKTVMVDFTASWCPNCKTNSRIAIEREAVLQMVVANRVEPLLADWSDKSSTIKKALNELGCNSIPVLAIWPAEPPDSKPIVLTDLLSEGQVLDALKKAGPSKKP